MLRILFGVSGQLRPRRTNKATKQSPSNSRQSDPLVGAALRASDDPERFATSRDPSQASIASPTINCFA